jgi:hypothetical protein
VNIDIGAYIANRDLRAADVPPPSVESLDLRGYSDGGTTPDGWGQLWTFALSFRGYEYFGGDDLAPGRLTSFDESVKEAYRADGKLPKLDLALLRACLFIEQRKWCKAGWGPMDPDSARYLSALLRAISSAIS